MGWAINGLGWSFLLVQIGPFLAEGIQDFLDLNIRQAAFSEFHTVQHHDVHIPAIELEAAGKFGLGEANLFPQRAQAGAFQIERLPLNT